MSFTPRILAFAGSTRADSFNKKVVRIAARGAEAAGAEVTLIDLRDYALPLFDGDLEAEEGLPENALRLKSLFKENHGLLIASPEYNSSLSAVLKNTIDWVSRPVPDELPLGAFVDKVAALTSASPGALGGLRGLVHLRSILSNIQVLVLPAQVAVMRAREAFTEEGTLRDPGLESSLTGLGARLALTIKQLKS